VREGYQILRAVVEMPVFTIFTRAVQLVVSGSR